MQFFTEAVNVLKTLVIALGAGHYHKDPPGKTSGDQCGKWHPSGWCP